MGLGEGGHAQYDQLNVALIGKKRPLIQDPGLYTYDQIADGANNVWVRTTTAHNSISVDDYSHARMDGYFGYSEPRLKSDGAGSKLKRTYVEGWHNGYLNIDAGGEGPRVARTIWFDGDETFLIVDWAKQKSPARHTLKVAFTIPLKAAGHADWGVNAVNAIGGIDANGVYTDTSNLTGTNRNQGNVMIRPVAVPNHPLTSIGTVRGMQDAEGLVTGPFVTAPAGSSPAEPAARFYMTERTDASHPIATFVTLVHGYDSSALADSTAGFDTSVRVKVARQSDDNVVVDLFAHGVKRRLQFYSPFMSGGSAQSFNADTTPTELDPTGRRVAALPRTTATPFPAGLESIRPPPLAGGQSIYFANAKKWIFWPSSDAKQNDALPESK